MFFSVCKTKTDLGQKNQMDVDQVYCTWQVLVRRSIERKDFLMSDTSFCFSMIKDAITEPPQEESSMAQTQVRTYFRAHFNRRTKTKSSKKLRIFRLG